MAVRPGRTASIAGGRCENAGAADGSPRGHDVRSRRVPRVVDAIRALGAARRVRR